MKIYKIAFFLIIISITCFAQIDRKEHLLIEKAEFFYLDSDPDIAKQIIKESLELKCIDKAFFFFVALAKEYPKEMIKWLTEAQVKFEQYPSLIHALHLGGLQKEAIQLALNAKWHGQKISSLGNKVQPFLDIPIGFPGSIPCMCSHFYVSGDAIYAKKIIDILELTEEQIKSPKELKELKEQAKAMLQMLIFKHDRIYQLCLEEVKVRKEETRIVLSQLLEDLHQAHRKAFPTKNEMLNGMILTTDDLSFEEQWEIMPAMEGPFFYQVSSIPYPEKEKIIKIIVLFNGCELDKDLNAYVTYDMEIFGPKGTKIGDCHDALALKRKIPNRFFSQKADQPMALAFQIDEEDEDDPVGIYHIKAIIKDHIGKKDLKLSTTFELLPKKKM